MIDTVLKSSTWTSAGGKNESVQNFINESRGFDNPDIEDEIRAILDDVRGDSNPDNVSTKDFSKIKKKVKSFDS